MVPCKRLIKLYRLPLFARIWYMCLPHMYSPGLILFKDLSRIWPILHCSPVNPGLAHSFCIKTTTSFWIKGLPNLHSIYPPPPRPAPRRPHYPRLAFDVNLKMWSEPTIYRTFHNSARIPQHFAKKRSSKYCVSNPQFLCGCFENRLPRCSERHKLQESGFPTPTFACVCFERGGHRERMGIG